MRRALRANPKLWRWAGDVAKQALDKVVEDVSGNSAFAVEGARQLNVA